MIEGKAKAAAAPPKAAAASKSSPPATPLPTVKAPSPQSTEKLAPPPRVTFEELPLKAAACSPPDLEGVQPPAGILKKSGDAPALLETQKDTQASQDPSRADTQQWDGEPSPGHLARMASVETVTSSGTT